MKTELFVVDNLALAYVVVGDFHDQDEKVMFLREGVEKALPRYLRYNPHGWEDAGCFLYITKELVTKINGGNRDQDLELRVISSYLQHNSCLERMSYLPYSTSNLILSEEKEGL